MSRFILEDGVYLSEAARVRFGEFETAYMTLREKEGQLLTLDQIKKLPEPPGNSEVKHIWKLRKRSVARFRRYLASGKKRRILEVGCGNGFFCELLRKDGHDVVGIDVNLTELKMAARAFPEIRSWYCADIMQDDIPSGPFDVIFFAASIQYFPKPDILLRRCSELLSASGEIHIMDSPFYVQGDAVRAASRSHAHFDRMGVPDLKGSYFHHTLNDLPGNKTFMYRPGALLPRLLGISDSPFPWIRLTI